MEVNIVITHFTKRFSSLMEIKTVITHFIKGSVSDGSQY